MINNNGFVTIDNTNFIFTTNFSGDPKRDTFGDSRRKVNVLIPSRDQAMDMEKAGYKVKQTKPGKNCPDPENFEPEYYVQVQLKYRKNNGDEVKWPPTVYLVTGKDLKQTLLNEDTVDILDKIRVKNVNVVLNPRYDREKNSWSLYIRTIYVEQDISDDPYAEVYEARRRGLESEDEPW